MSRITYEILELIYALKRQRVIIYSVGVLFLISFLVSYILILNIPWVQNFGKEMLMEFSTSLNLRNMGNMGMERIFFLIME
ncbi:MAG TPA: stage II sporulation protein M, partial [Methanothermococcus okinawensis]|nr:stage II sporulation protein M [Methanothermococcus okinawensis]